MANLTTWLDEIKRGPGRSGWIRVYKDAFHQPISDPPRFYSALELYGDSILYEAIVISYTKSLKDDPLNYILAVAHAKGQQAIDQQRDADKYLLNLEQDKAKTEAQSNTLAEKLERARAMATEV